MDEEPHRAEGGPPGSEEPSPSEDLPKGADLAGLYVLLQKTLKAHEHEFFKQEQRWRSVQVQLNQFHDGFEELRRHLLLQHNHQSHLQPQLHL